jgi:hypothetical protein
VAIPGRTDHGRRFVGFRRSRIVALSAPRSCPPPARPRRATRAGQLSGEPVRSTPERTYCQANPNPLSADDQRRRRCAGAVLRMCEHWCAEPATCGPPCRRCARAAARRLRRRLRCRLTACVARILFYEHPVSCCVMSRGTCNMLHVRATRAWCAPAWTAEYDMTQKSLLTTPAASCNTSTVSGVDCVDKNRTRVWSITSTIVPRGIRNFTYSNRVKVIFQNEAHTQPKPKVFLSRTRQTYGAKTKYSSNNNNFKVLNREMSKEEYQDLFIRDCDPKTTTQKDNRGSIRLNSMRSQERILWLSNITI